MLHKSFLWYVARLVYNWRAFQIQVFIGDHQNNLKYSNASGAYA